MQRAQKPSFLTKFMQRIPPGAGQLLKTFLVYFTHPEWFITYLLTYLLHGAESFLRS